MPWIKGQSGNPKGRQKGSKVLEITELAASHCADAIAVAVELMNGDDAKLKLQAAELLLERGIGRPSSTEIDIALISDERLVEEIRRREELHAERRREQSMDSAALSS